MKKIILTCAMLLLLPGCSIQKNKDLPFVKEQNTSIVTRTSTTEDSQADTKFIEGMDKVIVNNTIYSFGKKEGLLTVIKFI